MLMAVIWITFSVISLRSNHLQSVSGRVSVLLSSRVKSGFKREVLRESCAMK